MKYKNAIISTGKDILIVFICFFIFMFLSGGGTQNVLAAEDEVTITLDANGGEAVEPVVYKKTQSEIGILRETTRTGYVFNGWWTQHTMPDGQRIKPRIINKILISMEKRMRR